MHPMMHLLIAVAETRRVHIHHDYFIQFTENLQDSEGNLPRRRRSWELWVQSSDWGISADDSRQTMSLCLPEDNRFIQG